MKRNARHKFTALLLVSIASFAAPALAYDLPVPVAKVILVEVTYQPGAVFFQIDQPAANCPAGDYILWDGGASYPPGNAATEADRKSNVKQLTNTLLIAMHTNARVRVHARNKPGTGSCVVEFLHALPTL